MCVFAVVYSEVGGASDDVGGAEWSKGPTFSGS